MIFFKIGELFNNSWILFQIYDIFKEFIMDSNKGQIVFFFKRSHQSDWGAVIIASSASALACWFESHISQNSNDVSRVFFEHFCWMRAMLGQPITACPRGCYLGLQPSWFCFSRTTIGSWFLFSSVFLIKAHNM